MKFWIRFKKVLKNSVVTGIPQILATRNSSKRGLKTLIFLGCVTGFLWQTFAFLFVYWTYPTVVDVQYYFPDDFSLPAFSVCNFNGIKSKAFCHRFPELCHPVRSLDNFCRDHPYFCDPNENIEVNGSFPTVIPHELPPLARSDYRDMGLQVEDFLERCIIYEAPEVTDCTNDYEVVNVFDVNGLPNNCYSFNSMWGRPRGARRIKTKTLVFFFFKSERTHKNKFYTGTPFSLQVALHNPYSLENPFSIGFSLKPCSNYYLFPSKEVIELMPHPYSSECFNYTAYRLQRSGREPNNKRLCTEECYLNKSMEKAGCVDPFFINYPNMEKMCSEKVPSEVFDECNDQCPEACYREDIFVDVQEFSSLKSHERGKEKDNECYSTIQIAFNRMEVLKYQYAPKYEDISLFSYIGGYLGLWLGISLVAICDILETGILILQWSLEKVRRRRKSRNRIHHSVPKPIKEVQGQLWLL